MLKTNFKTGECNSNCSEMIRLHRNLIAIAEVYSRGSDKSRLHV